MFSSFLIKFRKFNLIKWVEQHPVILAISLCAMTFCLGGLIYFNTGTQEFFGIEVTTEVQSRLKLLTWIKGFFLAIVPLLGIPFLVWNYSNAYEAKETAKKNLEETQRNNQRTQENKMYVDCVNQLASDKETIRIAAIHGFSELLQTSQDEIEELQERKRGNEKEINRRINSQDKVLNILWSFMKDHSWEIKTAHEHQDKIEIEKQRKDIQKYYSQFSLVLEILAKFRNRFYDEQNQRKKFWMTKSWRDVYLQGIDLSKVNLSKMNFKNVDLSNANLTYVSFKQANLERANFNGSVLTRTSFTEANICGANLQNAQAVEYTKFKATYYNSLVIQKKDPQFGNDIVIDATKFPQDFTVEDKRLVDVSMEEG